MADGFATQDKRLIRLSTTLGDGVLIPISLTYDENMGQGFTLDLATFSEKKHNLSASDLVGTQATAVIVLESGEFRYINGYIQSFNTAPSTTKNNYTPYNLSLVSWQQLFLTRRKNSRIFQDKTIPEVIEAVLKDYGDTAKHTLKETRTYEPWRYLVQYNESDSNFINRLMAMAGFTSFFEHENGSHSLSIIDSSSLITDNEVPTIEIHPGTIAKDCFQVWRRTAKFVTGKFEQSSYNYIKPKDKLAVEQLVDGEAANIPNAKSISSFQYSENFTANEEGKALLTTVTHSESSQMQAWLGQGDHRQIFTGKNFSIARADNKPHPNDGKKFTATHVNIEANDTSGNISTSVTAIESGGLIYPSADKPFVYGLQTAIVVGKSGEEIQTDDLGRIKVLFHWDRSGVTDGQNTCFLRVMQSFASGGFGAHFTPRVGDEVVVAFENGNPDRPFVMGSLYNPENPPPYADYNGMRSGLRTRSTKGGSSDNCNELYFHDEKDQEEVFLQAEKDLNQLVKNDETIIIQNNQKLEVGNDKAVNVKNNYSTEVAKNHDYQTGENANFNVGKNYALDIGKKGQIDAGSELVLKVGGSTIKMSGGKIEISSSQIVINGSKVTLN